MSYSDTDDEMWIYQPHSRHKHKILRYYVGPWTKIVGDSNHRLHVVDCFAGRGDYVDSNNTEPVELTELSADVDYPGSPLILLDRLTERQNQFGGATCHFLEPRDENRDRLNENLSSISGLPEHIEYEVYDKTFENGAPYIERSKKNYGEFAFYFIDPFGLKDLEYDTVTSITSTPRVDTLITLMTKELIRWRNSEKHSDTFETLYGTSNWRSELVATDPEGQQTREAEYYTRRLREAGTEFTLAYMLERAERSELMYHLIYTSNADEGLELMHQSMNRCGTKFSLAYTPSSTDLDRTQTKLGAGGMMTERQRAMDYMKTRYAGKTVIFDEVVKNAILDRNNPTSVRQHYRDYLKEMDECGEVDIPKRDSEDDPLKASYEIHFPE